MRMISIVVFNRGQSYLLREDDEKTTEHRCDIEEQIQGMFDAIGVAIASLFHNCLRIVQNKG